MRTQVLPSLIVWLGASAGMAGVVGMTGCRAILGIDGDAPLLGEDGGPDLRDGSDGDSDGARDASDGSKPDADDPVDPTDRTEPLWPLPAESPGPSNYETTDETVLDKTTGLMWQRSISSRDTFVWGDAMRACSQLELGGFGDWRLPARIEMISLFDYGPNTDYINAGIFLDDARYSPQWTSSVYRAERAIGARWVVTTSSASVGPYQESSNDKLPLRCVRAGKTSNELRFEPEETTVRDARTGLSWESGIGLARDFASAKQRCDEMQPHGFRLPNVRELQSLIDEKRTEAPLWSNAFDPAPSGAVTSLLIWSSTVRTHPNTAHFYVDFKTGSTKLSTSDTRAGVRCVR